MIVSNLPNLQSFETGFQSFCQTKSLSLSSMIIKFNYLTFSNLPNLQSFKTGNQSFFKITSLSLSSMIIIFDYFTFSNLPHLQSFETGEWSFYETTSLSLSSMIIKYDILHYQIFLIYNHLKQEKDHSIQQQVYLFQVILSNSRSIN